MKGKLLKYGLLRALHSLNFLKLTSRVWLCVVVCVWVSVCVCDRWREKECICVSVRGVWVFLYGVCINKRCICIRERCVCVCVYQWVCMCMYQWEEYLELSLVSVVLIRILDPGELPLLWKPLVLFEPGGGGKEGKKEREVKPPKNTRLCVQGRIIHKGTWACAQGH